MLFSRLFAFTAVLALVAKTDAAPATDVDARLNKLSPKLDEVAKLDTKHEMAADGDDWSININLNVVAFNDTFKDASMLTSIGSYDCDDQEKCYCRPACEERGGGCTADSHLYFYSEAKWARGIHGACSFYVGDTNNLCSFEVDVPVSKAENTLKCSCTDPDTKIVNDDGLQYCNGGDSFPISGHTFPHIQLTVHAPECTICWARKDGDKCLTNGNGCYGPNDPGDHPGKENYADCKAAHGTWCPSLPSP